MSVKRFLWIILIYLHHVEGIEQCGGILTERKGVISTPNFPKPFTVPLKCQWIIDATEFITSINTSIIVYLTQVYVLEGLTFDEFGTYDSSYKIPGNRIHIVNEKNISIIRYVQSFQNVLTINFEMDSLENTHLRILDHLLDVYGFNMTYEITDSDVRSDACNMAICDYNGFCFDNFKKFHCNCFPGYSGSTCSEGKNSLCVSQGKSRCENGGSCKHIGANSVKCNCARGFYGERCEIRAQQGVYQDCEDCLISCPGNEKNDYIEYTISALAAIIGNVDVGTLLNQLQIQISNLLRKTDFRINYVRVSNVTKLKHGTEITVFCYGAKKDKKRVEEILSDFLSNSNRENVTLRRYTFPPPKLIIQSVGVNPMGIIRQGDEFILSCVTQGPPGMKFFWMKDSLLINITKATNNKWTRIIQDPHVKDQYTSLLGIQEASYLDQGMFTCQVEDDNYRQCLSKKVTVKQSPHIKIEPISLTVQKGEDFTLKCVQIGEQTFNKFTYSWTKNKELLPIKTESEKYEILYPQGSILQVFKVDKPAIYSCLVQDGDVSSEMTIQVDVIDRNRIKTCTGEKLLDVLWPDTAPGSYSIQNCPNGFSGLVQRNCMVQDANRAQWQMPDFSLCTVDSLIDVDLNFEKLKLGYESTNCMQILQAYENYLVKRSNLFPGEGARILKVLLNVVTFNKKSINSGDVKQLATIVYNICSRILTFKDSLINEKQIVLLQQLLRLQIFLLEATAKNNHFLHFSSETLDINLIYSGKDFTAVPLKIETYPAWYTFNMKLNINQDDLITLGVILYKNLTEFLPSRSVIRLKDGTELEYEIVSKIVASWPLKSGEDASFTHDLNYSMEFVHKEINSSKSNWNVYCSMAQFANYGFSWDINNCHTIIVNKTLTRCICFQSGTFAVLITNRPRTVIAEERKNHYVTSLIGCGCCLLFSAISLVVLTIYWSFQKSCLVFLKIQCCLSLTATMAIFVAVLAKDFPAKYYSYVITMLEIFILVALSSQISKFLLVLTELVQFSKTPNIKKTVIAITTGIPITTVFGSHLSHQSMGKSIKSWWLLTGSLSFYIFISCFIITFILFLLVNYIVMKKLNACITQEGGNIKLYTRRKKCLQRSTCIFICICLTIVSSTIYVNYSTSILSDYAFCLSSVFLGSVLFFCYVIKPEHGFNKQDCLQKLRVKKKINTQPGLSLNIYSKQSPECENDCGVEYRGQENPRSTSTFSPQDCCSDCTFGPNISQQCGRCRELENYKSSPKKFKDTREEYNQNFATPDVISTRVCVELDLVTPLLNQTSENPTILCNIAVNPQGGNRNFQVPYISITEDSQNEDNKELTEEIPAITHTNEEDTKEEENPISDRLDGMLSKISHDLDYLLNRSANVQPPTANAGIVRKNSMSTSSRMEQIEEETESPEETLDLQTKC